VEPRALAVFDLTRELLSKKRRKIAIIADDVFQAIGLDKAAAYATGLLNLIKHPAELLKYCCFGGNQRRRPAAYVERVERRLSVAV